MAEHDPAKGARCEAEGISGEGEQGPDQRIERGEEQFVEHQRGGRAVEEEIVPFDRRADHARRDHARERASRPGRACCHQNLPSTDAQLA
jgi:hypothetical protein